MTSFSDKSSVRAKVLIIAVTMLCLSVLANGQQSNSNSEVDWSSLKFLQGTWVGEGTAETGQAGSGSCSFEPGLQGKVLLRKNHSEYPAADGRPAIVHEDVMIIYPDKARHQLRAFYTDNEGNVINYTVTAKDGKNAEFLSDAAAGVRRYRLTYTVTQPDHMTINFDMAQPDKPEQFQKFIEGKLKRQVEAGVPSGS